MSRLRPAYLTVLLFLSLGCSDQESFPTGRAAVALFRVYREPPTVLGFPGEGMSDRDYDVLRNTQINLLRSHFVLEAAMRPVEVAEIPQIAHAEDAIEWVKERLHARFPGNGEIMEVAVFDDALSDEQLETLTDSICSSYLQEVVDGERTHRLYMKDVLSSQLNRVTNELTRKRQEHAKLAEGLGQRESAFRRARIDMVVNQHRDVTAERRAVAQAAAEATIAGAQPSPEAPPEESEGNESSSATSLAANGNDPAAVPEHETLQERLNALDHEAENLEEELAHLARHAAELAYLEDEIRSLEHLADKMRDKLLLWDVELNAGSPVKPIQSAVISEVNGEDDRPVDP